MEESSLYGAHVFCITGDFIGGADVFKRRGGWFTVEVDPFLTAEYGKFRKGFRDENKAREYARDMADRFLLQAIEHANGEHPDWHNDNDFHVSYSEDGYVTNDPQY